MDQTEKPIILFLMMQNPDIDHLVPIAVLLAETKKHTIKVLTYQERVDFNNDSRIRYLIDDFGITVRPISYYYPFFSNFPWKLYKIRSYWAKKMQTNKTVHSV